MIKTENMTDYQLLLVGQKIIANHWNEFFTLEKYENYEFITLLIEDNNNNPLNQFVTIFYFTLEDIPTIVKNDISSHIKDRYKNISHYNINYLSFKNYNVRNIRYSFILDFIKEMKANDPKRFQQLWDHYDIEKQAAKKEKAREKSKLRSEITRAETFNLSEQKILFCFVRDFFAEKSKQQLEKLIESDQFKFPKQFSFSVHIHHNYDLDSYYKKLLNNNIYDKTGKEFFETLKENHYCDEILGEMLISNSPTCRRFAVAFGKNTLAVGLLDNDKKTRLLSKRKQNN